MRKRISRVMVFFFLTVLGVGVLNVVTSSAYRGIDAFVCRELAGLFAKGPGLLRYKDLERLGDCVAFYKRIYSVLRRGAETQTEGSKLRPK